MADIPLSDQCAPLHTGGYECDFVDPPPDFLNCSICLLPFRDLHLLSCCGANICETCIGRVEAAGQPCLLCKQPFNSMLDRKKQRKVLNLKVRCSRKKVGCEREGELRHLEKHEREECGWALVQCRYKCSELVTPCQLREHELDECPQRPLDVKLESSMRKMEGHHQREMAAVRKQMEQQKEEYEAKMEQLEQSLQRKLRANTEQQNKESILRMEQVEQCLQRRLKVDTEQLRKKDEVKMVQLEQSLQRKLRADTEQQVVKLRKEVEKEVFPKCALMKEMRGILINSHPLHSCEFIMTNYQQHKRDSDRWYSPPFYTGPGGYKMCLRVDANGYVIGTGTHVSVLVYLMRGENDDQLKWPFQGDITIQLVNQKRDQGHVTRSISFDDDAIAYGSAVRVATGERSTMGRGIPCAISHDAVESTTETTQFLHNDCLKWRVTNIVVHSV